MRMPPILLALATSLAAQPALLDFIRNGDRASLASALKNGADANIKDADDVTALMYAAIYSNASDMKLLIQHGADVKAVNKWGGTALMAAISDFAKVRLLVEKGAEVNTVAQGTSLLNEAGRLPSGQDIAEFLISKGAKPDVAFVRRAAIAGHQGLVETGLRAGVEAKSINVESILDAKILQILLSRGARNGLDASLQNNAYYGNTASVRALLEHGAGVTTTDNRQRTVVHYAAGSDFPQPEILSLLLERGADPKAKDVRGDDALDWARLRGDAEMIRLLGGTAVKAEPATKATSEAPLPSVRDSVQRAIQLLEAAGPEFFKLNACISCHSQSIPQMAAGAVSEKGIALNAKAEKLQTQSVLAVWNGFRNRLWLGDCSIGGGRVATITYGLLGLAAVKQPLNQTVSLVTNCLAVEQAADGSWSINDLRAPLGMSRIKYTALGMHGLQLYPLPGRKAEFTERIRIARTFLETAQPKTAQDLSFQLLGLTWAGAPAADLQKLRQKLVAMQRPDGGWAQRAELNTDAYATAQAVWALKETDDGAALSKAAWSKGTEYLRRNQKADGSWHVRSRGFGFQPYRETGFPHGHDQWLSAAATGFAVIALSPLIEK